MGSPEPLLSSAQVSELLQMPISTLDRWAYRGEGPAFAKLGKHRRYRRCDIEAFIESRLKSRTRP